MKFTASSRINTFDLLRGWCLAVILSDHMLRFPSVFDVVTGRGLLWVTAAEGFFFISGTLVGLVRGRKMLQNGLRAATKDLWIRAGKLYTASILLTLLFSGLGYWLANQGLEPGKGGLTYFASVWDLVLNTFSLHYSYGWTDFLNFYVIFLLVSPAALWLMAKGKWWLVLGLSVLLWCIKGASWVPLSTAYLTWQVYFFVGLVFGYHFERLQSWYRSAPAWVAQATRTWLVGLTAVTVALSFIFTFATPFYEHHGATLAAIAGRLHLPNPYIAGDFFRDTKDAPWFGVLFQNNRTGLLRLPLFILWFSALFMLVRRYEHTVLRRLGWLLLPLGRNSLYVYIIQGVLVFLLGIMALPSNILINSLMILSALMGCWYAVKQQFLFKIIPR